jgi:exosortase/archaeosortase family protein
MIPKGLPMVNIARHSAMRRLLPFVLSFAALQGLWQLARGGAVEFLVVHHFTVQPAVALINWLTPDAHAQALRFSIAAIGGGLNILNGCEGIEAFFLLLSAFLVAPLPWRARLLGLFGGFCFVFLINQARILLLFYAYRINRAWFDPLHSLVMPLLVVILVCAYFYGCLYLTSNRCRTR